MVTIILFNSNSISITSSNTNSVVIVFNHRHYWKFIHQGGVYKFIYQGGNIYQWIVRLTILSCAAFSLFNTMPTMCHQRIKSN